MKIAAEIQNFTRSDFTELLDNMTSEIKEELSAAAREIAAKSYSNKVYTRGLIEFTNYCKNNCYYCGIRFDNKAVSRYRLTPDEILACCETGYSLGYRTFVLQGGEDPWFSDSRMMEIIKRIKEKYPDCALTLSLGERSKEAFQMFYDAGADRYLLRHETANDEHYAKLHPQSMRLSSRKACLYSLRQIGYQVGAGFMVGSPYQTNETLADDLIFLKDLNPHMVGIGPFIPQKDTPFGNETAGSVEKTLVLLSIIRILLPQVLLPATTALGTLDKKGREKALLAGANVVMPNLSPISVRKKYLLYDNKICTGEEAAQCFGCLSRRISSVGFEMNFDRGDHVLFANK